MTDLIIICAALFTCGAITLSFTIVVGFALYSAYRESVNKKLYKSKVTQDNQLSMNGLPKPTQPVTKCKSSRKEPCCDCGRSMSKYFED